MINSFVKIEYNICYFLFIWILSARSEFNPDLLTFLIIATLVFVFVDVFWIVFTFMYKEAIISIFDFIDDKSYFIIVMVSSIVLCVFKLILIPLLVLFRRNYIKLNLEKIYMSVEEEEREALSENDRTFS